MKIEIFGNVEAKRGQEMPTIQRQLDVLWRALTELQAGGYVFSFDVQHMLDRVKSVQNKYPYPPEGS